MNTNTKKFTDPTGLVSSDNAVREEKILQFWSEKNIFKKTLEKDSPMGEYTFFEGPPTANGRPGVHHVGARSFKDIIPRYKTMRGFHVNRKAGWDTHGLPVELQVEKELGLKNKQAIAEYGVALFNQKCRESVWTYKDEWEAVTDRMGFWLDMENPYITYKNDYIEGVWSVIKKISQRTTNGVQDLLYKDFKILPWCSRCGTALSSHELSQPGAYQDVKDVTAYVKFPIVGFDRAYFIAWTTTPWTLAGNVALAVGPDIDYVEARVGDEIFVVAKELVSKLGDEYEIIAEHKGSEMVGMKYEPLYPFISNLLPSDQQSKLENSFQVYAADFVTTTDGTGIVHIAPMYGADDFELATKHNLPKYHIVNEQGNYIAGCDTKDLKLSGRYVKELDEAGKPTLAIDIINNLTERGLLFKKENYAHSYPHCWRCNTPLLYYARGSWYFRMSALREQLLASNENINWEPDHIKSGRFGEWLDGIRDWAISRDRYWGTPLPIWENADGSKRVVIGSCDELMKYTQNRMTKIIFVRHGQGDHNVTGISSSAHDKHPLTALGIEQSKNAATKLMDHDIDVVYCSPILRARQTMDEYLKISGKEFILDDRLGEITSGSWEEKTQHDSDVFAEREVYKNLPTEERYNMKRGETGESFADLDIRTKSFLDEILVKHAGKTVVIFSHQGTQSSMMKQLKGISNDQAVNEIFHNNNYTANAHPVFMYVDTTHKRELDLHKPYIDDIEIQLDGETLKRVTEVIDVWFDSGAMPYVQNHVLGNEMNWTPQPADYIAEGADQTRGWFYTMHAIANLLNDTPTNNYRNVICLGLLMSTDGTKMSKSKGNIVSPWEVFQKFGADVARFWFYSVNNPGETKNFDEKSLDEVNKKVFNPLRNVVSFYEMYRGDNSHFDEQYNPYGDNSTVLDRWILAKFDTLEIAVTTGLDNYDIVTPARAIREFINELSTWYIRRSRERFKSNDIEDRNRALHTTGIVLRSLARVMAPFTPFIAEEIWQQVKQDSDTESVHLSVWLNRKNADINWSEVLEHMQTVRDIVTLGLEARQRADIKVRQPLSSLTISSNNLSEEYLDIVKDELNVKEIITDESLENNQVILDTNITPELRDEGDMRDIIRKVQDMRKTANLVPTDRIIATVTDNQPTWFTDNNVLHDELMTTVGAESIVWNGEGDKVEKV